MMSAITSVSEIDRFIGEQMGVSEELLRGFLRNMHVERPCESYILARMNGYRDYPECPNRATVGDTEVVFDFCPSCYQKFVRGTFEPLVNS